MRKIEGTIYFISPGTKEGFLTVPFINSESFNMIYFNDRAVRKSDWKKLKVKTKVDVEVSDEEWNRRRGLPAAKKVRIPKPKTKRRKK